MAETTCPPSANPQAGQGCRSAAPTGLDPRAPEPVVLRPATPDDAAALALVGAATFLEAYTWMLPGPDIIDFCRREHTPEVYARFLSQPSTRITLALTGPRENPQAPVGYAMVTAPDLPSIDLQPGDVELKRIYLFSRFRTEATPVLDAAGQPIAGLRAGQALMDAALASARSLGAGRLLLGTHAGNERALRFYRRNGFVDVGTRTFQVGNQRCCDLVLARTLDS